MRYLLLFFVYFVISIILLLGILFPERMTSPLDFFILTLYFVPCVGTFDVLGQRLMEKTWFSNLSFLLKASFGLIAIIIFIFAMQMMVNIVGMNTEPW